MAQCSLQGTSQCILLHSSAATLWSAIRHLMWPKLQEVAHCRARSVGYSTQKVDQSIQDHHKVVRVKTQTMLLDLIKKVG